MSKGFAVTALAATLLSVLAGCNSPPVNVVAAGSDAPSASTGASPSGSTGASPSGSTGAPPSGSADASARPTDCTVGQLRITTGQSDAGLSHRSIAVVFRNTSRHACQMRGYPGVAALNRKGMQLAQARRTLNGYLGGLHSGDAPPTVDLTPGQIASALVEAVAPICSGNEDSTCGDQWYTALLVTPPNDSRSVTLSWPTGDAGQLLQVHPVVPGKTGGT